MKQQDLDPPSLCSSAAYSEPSNDLKPLRSSLSFCSNIHVHRSFRYEDGSYDHPRYLKQMRAVWVSLGQIPPIGTGIYLAKHGFSLSCMKQKACPLYIMIYSWEISRIRFSFHRIALNFLSHGAYEHLNPGFPGHSHLLSVTGIHMALMGKRKSLFYPPATELNGDASSRNALLRSHGMLKVNELCWTAEQKLIKVHHYTLVSLYLPKFGSNMIKVHVSRIMWSQLEESSRRVAKSYMRNTITQPGWDS